MPKSEKRKLQDDIDAFYAWKILRTGPGIYSSQKFTEDYLCMCELVSEYRYGADRNFVAKSVDWRLNILPTLSADQFRQQLRVNRSTFNSLIGIIQGYKGFHTTRQSPIDLQLAVTLYRLGRSGNGASVADVSSRFDISEGCVLKYTDRVISALNERANDYIMWPSETQVNEIKNRFNLKGFPGCVGLIDGTHVSFYEKPVECHEDYYSRKQRYGMQLQVIVDDQKRIIHVYTGMPSSVHDSTVFKRSGCETTISNSYILGDSAYCNSQAVVTPFRKKTTSQPLKERVFNYQHSHARVAVEHAIGILKNRFQCLKELRLRIDRKVGHKKACQWIIACCVLHNIIFESDPWVDFDLDNNNEEPLQVLHSAPGNRMSDTRQNLMELIWKRKLTGDL